MSSGSPETEESAYRTFVVFVFCWCFFLFLHQILTSPNWTTIGSGFLQSRTDALRTASGVGFLFLLATLFRPSNPAFFLPTVVVLLITKFDTLPKVPNHILLSLVLHAMLLCTFLTDFRGRDQKQRVARWCLAFAPPLRVSLILLYGLAVFHKLNTDFFHISVSCAAQMYERVATSIWGLPVDDWSKGGAIWMTLLAEACIPIILFFSRWRVMGVILAAAFHLFLALHPNQYIYSFSAEMYALLVLFLPTAVVEKIYSWGTKMFSSILGKLYFLVLVGLPLCFSVRVLWNCWAVVFILGVAVAWYAARSDQMKLESLNLSCGVIPSALLVLLLLNGFAPFLGLKTETTFSMFSNLRIDGEASNHLLIRRVVPVGGWLSDTVEIVEAEDPYLKGVKERNARLTVLELQRYLINSNVAGPVRLRRNNGSEIEIDAAAGDHTDLPTPSPLALKFLSFREIAAPGPNPCQW